MAGAWAVFVHMGKKGFLETANHYHQAYTTILAGFATFFSFLFLFLFFLLYRVDSIDGLRTVGRPDACTIAYTSDELDIYKIADAMLTLGWSVNRLQKPRCIQIQVGSRKNFDAEGYVHVCILFNFISFLPLGKLMEMIKALRQSVSNVRENPNDFKGGLAGIYGLANTLAEASSVSVIKGILTGYMDALYLTSPPSSE